MTDDTKAARLEVAIRVLTKPINGQYPRPWMTDSKDPASSKVFLVGKSQAKKYEVSVVGSHQRHMDALFNRDRESCRHLYDWVTGNDPSPTRQNMDDLVRRLVERHGVPDVLETNVICYSAGKEGLNDSSHIGGAARGREIFQTLFEIIEPRVMIVFGSGTVDELSRAFGRRFPRPPAGPSKPVEAQLARTSVFVIPSLAPPESINGPLGAINISTISAGSLRRVWDNHLGGR